MPWHDELVKKTYSVKSLTGLAADVKTPTVQSKICGHCGYAFSTFLKTGYLGCSECYLSFRTELEHYLDELR